MRRLKGLGLCGLVPQGRDVCAEHGPGLLTQDLG